ncbi:hypothetical protein ACH4T9_10850 [Micromonospora sp. NPDC020750]|uniref:hypothetical protein n=1 Tax=unclassified Micromonospora TaxID=2617518 RepID=UPI0037A89026
MGGAAGAGDELLPLAGGDLHRLRAAAADHLCLLLSFTNDRFDLAREAAERGNAGRALKDLWLAQQAVADAPTAYQLWMRYLGELADVSPGSLGDVGEMLMGFESFLHAAHGAGSGNGR